MTKNNEPTKRSKKPLVIFGILCALLLAIGVVFAYHTDTENIINRLSIGSDKEVTVEWRETSPLAPDLNDAVFDVNRIKWNQTTAEYDRGGAKTTLSAYSVGNDGTESSPDAWIFLSDEQTEDYYKNLLIGSEVTVTNSLVPIPKGTLFYIELDSGSTEHPTSGGKTYSKYRMTLKPYITTTIKEYQLTKLTTVEPVHPTFKGYVCTGWTTPQSTGIDTYVVRSTWAKRPESTPDENSAYAAIYGSNTLVFGRGAAPESYNSLPLSANAQGVSFEWYGLEDDIYTRAEVPWKVGSSAITKVVVKDTIAPPSIAYWFETLENLTSVDISKLDTSKAIDAQSLFGNCTKLTNVDLSMLDMSAATNINNMFYHCTSLTSVKMPSTFTSNLKEVAQVFYECTAIKNIDMSMVDTSGATNFNRLFYHCDNLATLNVSTLNTANVVSMIGVFENCSALKVIDLTSWNTQNVTDMSFMFRVTAKSGETEVSHAGALTTIKVSDVWSTDAVIASEEMFVSCPNLVGSKGTKYSTSHQDAEYARIDGSRGRPGYLSGTLGQETFNEGVQPFAVYSATDHSLSFYNRALKLTTGQNFNGKIASKVYVDVYNARTSIDDWMNASVEKVEFVDKIQPTNTAYWFFNMKKLTEIKGLNNLDTTKVVSMQSMFNGCSVLTSLDLSSFNFENVTDMASMFYRCALLKDLNWSLSKASNVKDTSYMFSDCSSLITLDLSSFDTATEKMSNMFSNCSQLTDLDISHLNTAYTTTMYYMFNGCTALTSLDLSSFDWSSAVNINWMFYKCTSLKTIYASSNLSDDYYTTCENGWPVFANCEELIGGNGTAYKTGQHLGTYARIDGSEGKPGYFTYKEKQVEAFAVYSADDDSLTFYKRDSVPAQSSSFNNKTATLVIENIEQAGVYDSTKLGTEVSRKIRTVTIADEIAPKDMSKWFWGMYSLVSIDGLSKIDTSQVKDMQSLFCGCLSLISLDLSNFETPNVTNMNSMFGACEALKTIDMSGIDFTNVTNMSRMFGQCSALTEVKFGSSVTSNLDNTFKMFEKCETLTELDLSNFDMRKVTNPESMFSSCYELKTIYASESWALDSLTTDCPMFEYCDVLEGGNGTTARMLSNNGYDFWAYSSSDLARIDGKDGYPGYLTCRGVTLSAAESTLSKMSLHDQICQMFTVYPSQLTSDANTSNTIKAVSDTEKETLQAYPYGGVCYFLSNIEGEAQAKKFSSDLQAASKTPLFIAVDEEGGRVQRIGGTAYDGAKRGAGIGYQLNAMQEYENDGTDVAKENAKKLASNCKRIGCNWDYAPVADVNSNPDNPVIGKRAYSSSYTTASELVSAAVSGFAESNIGTSLKHFPGHGDTATDSHLGAASVSKTLDQLREEDFLPFEAGIAAGADSVMVGHLMIEGTQTSVPATCSKEIVTDVLREELNFDGVIVTDGMQMGAITKVYGKDTQGYINAVLSCLDAGIDVFLLAGEPQACVDAIEAKVAAGEIDAERIHASVMRILKMKEKLGLLNITSQIINEVESELQSLSLVIEAEEIVSNAEVDVAKEVETSTSPLAAAVPVGALLVYPASKRRYQNRDSRKHAMGKEGNMPGENNKPSYLRE